VPGLIARAAEAAVATVLAAEAEAAVLAAALEAGMTEPAMRAVDAATAADAHRSVRRLEG
jgi:hypothetical protein